MLINEMVLNALCSSCNFSGNKMQCKFLRTVYRLTQIRSRQQNLQFLYQQVIRCAFEQSDLTAALLLTYVNSICKLHCTRGDPEICGKVQLNCVAFIDCNKNEQI